MLKNLFTASIMLGLCAGLSAPAFASSSDDDRTNTGKKGSLVILPSVEIRYDSITGDLIQDTFITLSNDRAAPVRVKVYYINGDEPLDFDPNTGERAHTGWNAVDFVLTMTPDEPYYWSLAQPSTPSAFGQLPRSFNDVDSGFPRGRPDPKGGDYRVVRGAVLMYAMSMDPNKQNTAIRYNNLSCKATAVNYADGSAYETNAYAFQNQEGDNGTPLSTEPTRRLVLDGGAGPDDDGTAQYDGAPAQLLVDAFTDGSMALSGGGVATVVNTCLNLLVLDMDLTITGGPATTLAFFTVHRQDEVPLTWSNQDYCITCWRSSFLSGIRPDVFQADLVNANRVKARIETFWIPQICAPFFRDGSTATPIDRASPLLGMTIKNLDFAGQATGTAATPLVGQGAGQDAIETATIRVAAGEGGPIIPGGDLTDDAGKGELNPVAPSGRRGRRDR